MLSIELRGIKNKIVNMELAIMSTQGVDDRYCELAKQMAGDFGRLNTAEKDDFPQPLRINRYKATDNVNNCSIIDL